MVQVILFLCLIACSFDGWDVIEMYADFLGETSYYGDIFTGRQVWDRAAVETGGGKGVSVNVSR